MRRGRVVALLLAAATCGGRPCGLWRGRFEHLDAGSERGDDPDRYDRGHDPDHASRDDPGDDRDRDDADGHRQAG